MRLHAILPRTFLRWLRLLALFFACLPLGACTRVAGIAHTSAINVGQLFRGPARLGEKIANPVRPGARLAVLWVGHSTFLVQMDDKLILTDPVFTSSVGQVVTRLVEPGLDIDAVPPLDAVLVSHMHEDHLSVGSLEALSSRIGLLVAPTQGLVYVPDGPYDAEELATWQSIDRDGLTITAVPVHHGGSRYAIDDAWMNRSMTGYVLEYHGLTVYFGGDTYYVEQDFIETRRRFPSIDLALLPIGPIHPRSVMRTMHLDPEEAVQAFLDLGAKRMVPMHYGTFRLSTDEVGEPLRVLRDVMRTRGLSAQDIVILSIGEQRVFSDKAPPMHASARPSALSAGAAVGP